MLKNSTLLNGFDVDRPDSDEYRIFTKWSGFLIVASLKTKSTPFAPLHSSVD